MSVELQLERADKYSTLRENLGELVMMIKHRSGQQSITYNDMYRVYEGSNQECNVTVDNNYLDTPLGTISRPNLVLRFYNDEGDKYVDGVLDIVREIPSRVVYVRDVYEMVVENYKKLLAYEAEEVDMGDVTVNLSVITSEFPGFDLVEVTKDAEVYELAY